MARVLIRELGPERSAMAIDRVRAMVAGGGSPSRRMEERPRPRACSHLRLAAAAFLTAISQRSPRRVTAVSRRSTLPCSVARSSSRVSQIKLPQGSKQTMRHHHIGKTFLTELVDGLRDVAKGSRVSPISPKDASTLLRAITGEGLSDEALRAGWGHGFQKELDRLKIAPRFIDSTAQAWARLVSSLKKEA